MTDHDLRRTIISLRDIFTPLSSIGENGVMLARLYSASLPCPPGFFISSTAYMKFAKESGFFELMQNAFSEIKLENQSEIDELIAKIQQFFIKNPIPSEILEEIHQALVMIDGIEIESVIQGSVCLQDFSDPLFFESFYFFKNASGIEEIDETIKKCWASLWTPQSIQYVLRNHLAPESIQMAVIVQKSVSSDADGLMLTVDPENGRCDRILIDTFIGSPADQKTPTYRIAVHKKTGKVIHWKTTSREIVTIRSPFGVYRIPVHPVDSKNAVLKNRQASDLAKLGMMIENLLQKPVAVNWKIKDRSFSVIEVHPVNDFLGVKKPWIPLITGTYLKRSRLVDLFPDPVTPLFETLGIPALNQENQKKRLISKRFFRAAFFDLEVVNGYVYQNFRDRITYQLILLNAFFSLKNFTCHEKNDSIENSRIVLSEVEKWNNTDLKSQKSVSLYESLNNQISWSAARYADLIQNYVPSLICCDFFAKLFFATFSCGWNDQNAEFYLSFLKTGHEKVEKQVEDITDWIQSQADPAVISNIISSASASEIDLHHLKYRAASQDLNHRLSLLKSSFDSIPLSLDFGRSLCFDKIEYLLRQVKDRMSENKLFSETIPEKNQMQPKSRFHSFIDLIRKKWFLKNIGRILQCHQSSETLIADLGRCNAIIQQSIQELGNRLKTAGGLKRFEDIAWITARELREAVGHLDVGESVDDLSNKIQERKTVWEQNFHVIRPDVIPLDARWKKFCMMQRGQMKEIKGTSVREGLVTAPACVIRCYEDFLKIQTGDVIVVAMITPAWMHLITKASAIVVDSDGMVHDRWILANSSKIPIITNTKTGTRLIQTGQIVTVNGNQGTVRLE